MFEPERERAARRVALETVDDPACRALLDRFAAADLLTGVWETTSDIGVPAFFAWIMERTDGAGGAARSAIGQGCHLEPRIALSRALTEAAQHRLTVISGARDDLVSGSKRHAARRELPRVADLTLSEPGGDGSEVVCPSQTDGDPAVPRPEDAAAAAGRNGSASTQAKDGGTLTEECGAVEIRRPAVTCDQADRIHCGAGTSGQGTRREKRRTVGATGERHRARGSPLDGRVELTAARLAGGADAKPVEQ
jgi:hypothetical protein